MSLSKQPSPQPLVDKINADEDRAVKEQKAQDWVVANVDSAPDTPSFEEVWIAGYEQGDREAVERSMTHIEKQGGALANTEHELGLFKKENTQLREMLKFYADTTEKQVSDVLCVDSRHSKLEAENARLREALEEIVNKGPASPGDKKHEIARAALGEK